jgi:hypothetical protein
VPSFHQHTLLVLRIAGVKAMEGGPAEVVDDQGPGGIDAASQTAVEPHAVVNVEKAWSDPVQFDGSGRRQHFPERRLTPEDRILALRL